MNKMIAIATSAALLINISIGAVPVFANQVQSNYEVRTLVENNVNNVNQASTAPFDLYGKDVLVDYNAVYKMDNANIASITNNGGNYPNSQIQKAIDGNMATHWETGKPNSAIFTNEVIFNLNESTSLDRIVYAARQSGAPGKGFAQQFEIYSSATDNGDDFTLVSTGEYKGSTGHTIEIKFAATEFKRIKFVFTKANQDWASAAEFSFYMEDKVRDAISDIFTDGTMSSVVTAYNQVDKINALDTEAQAHPLYSMFRDQLELAKKLVNSEVDLEGTIITAEQRGDMRKHAQQNLRVNFGVNNQPTGFVAMPGETVNIYVDVKSTDKLPSVVFSQQEAAWNVWATSIQLRPGKNTITVPRFAKNSYYAHDVTPGGTVYIVNPYTAEEQGKAPLIRFEGLEKIPFMTADTDPEEFKTFLIDYKQRLDADKAANPNVKDRQLIDVVEMVSDHVIFTGTATIAYNTFITQGNNPMDTITGYDAWMKTMFDFYGFDGSSILHDPKLIRENIRLMQPFGAMYAAGDHTGIQMGTVSTMLADFNKSYPGWGLNHEIGHRLAVGEREYGEITNNMLSMLMSVHANSIDNRVAIDNRIPYESTIYKYVIEENKVVMNDQPLFAALGAYWQLELAHPGYWTELNRMYRERKVSLANGDNSKQQYLVEFSSEVLGMDLSSYFARHGFTVNPETREKTAVYPAPKKLWYLNNTLINYEGTGITSKDIAIKVGITANATAKSNTLNFTIDKSVKEDFLGYEIYRNDKLVGFTGTDQFIDQNIDPSVNYTYTIIGYDKKLNTLNPLSVKAFIPTLSVEDQVTLKLNQPFDPMNYVKATNYQGKDITSEVVVKSNNVNVSRKGNYEVVYEVKNEQTTETKTTNVTVTSNYMYASDLNAQSAKVGSGAFQKDKAANGGIITLNRHGLPVTYSKGLAAHANSEVIYNIEGRGYDFFESYIGIDQAAKGRPSSATFEIYVDGEKVFNSGVFLSNTEHEYVKVAVTGAKEIKLVTTDANNNGNNYDHTVWADAKFTNNSSMPTLTVPEEMGVVKLNDEFDILSGVEAFDIEDGNLIEQVDVQLNEFNTDKTGTYIIQFTVTDSDGNTVTQTRTVVVYSSSQYATDVEWDSARTDYNVVRKDKSSTNATIKLLVNGETKEFAKGIGTHANSEIVYNVGNTNYEYFETYIGVDRNISAQNNSSVIFKIMADGQEVYNSGLMKYNTEAQFVRIPVKGIAQLTLIVDNAGNGNASDHGNFADAKFLILNSIPELTIGASTSTKVGQAISVSAEYLAIDAEDGNITSQVVVTGEEKVNFNRAGQYPITYTITDKDGNTITKTRIIAVVDMEDFKYVSDYDWKSTQNSYTAPKKDIAISGKVLRLTDENNAEVTYAKGIGAHSNSTIVYDLTDKDVNYFTSFVGVDRQMYNTVGSVTFEVYVDGEKKFDSGLMNSRDVLQQLEVNLSGAKELKLVVTDGGNGNGSDHAVWGDAKFHYANGDRLYTSDLVTAIEATNAISLDGYTSESIAALQNSLSSAEAVLANEDATQAEIDAALVALQKATGELTLIDFTQVITISDKYLNEAIKKTLAITGEITLGDMYNLTTLTCDSRRVRSLDGLQYAKNLVTLDIAGNEVADFSPLQDLTKLDNLIADPQFVEVGTLQGPIVEVANVVKNIDGNYVIPTTAGVRNNATFNETIFDVNEWAANPDKFTLDLSNEDKGVYTFVLNYEVAGNHVMMIYMIDNK
ncbi:MAG: NPCBM/NEW2 domain-containing protein [Candidatus Pristimantibacillus lignocellulolyticus]|uniref:NPCBM/NEW2 domain-containing protein n=1 Tax=Candidatus Pristimantibacillus lignocellulolyticus TaxID=2994561 RepID=A0A9J6ZI71_9BACL|nr:MAG: NPCBM/NEW2 domain-containing protein [Candidatus Pristimantibacillus lignocellulolyticus]